MMQSKLISPAEHFLFRNLQPIFTIVTASDRYAGWMGQIYSRERFEKSVKQRSKRLGKKTFKERVLPVESVEEYFLHFSTLELDFTFYRTLLDREGTPTKTFTLLQDYKRYLNPENRLILKAPQAVFSRKLRRQGGFVENEQYLDPHVFINQFYNPAKDLLGPLLQGIVFEQEYQRRDERPPVKRYADQLQDFFGAIPTDARYHVELRTEAFLSEAVLRVFEDKGVGQVFSHWTWLPSLSKQFSFSQGSFFNKNRCIIRLMTPKGVRYQDAYGRAYPFDKVVEGMQSPEMVKDTVMLVQAAIGSEVPVSVIINNRAGGNAPGIAQQIATEFLK
jgi:uncharacterized protein YecE (DUF72 family)